MNVTATETSGVQTTAASSDIEQEMEPLATQVLHQLSITLAALERFRGAQQAQLDRWEAESLAVTEQSLQRARLAFSQLHADLLRRSRNDLRH